ncbi:MAG TPA: hypothetical protein VNS50_12495 [Ginsengibacter sp.]|nr:hypothetical protein [Ginsengibacter sp.]
MKHYFNFSACKSIPFIAILIILNYAVVAQVDTTKPAPVDTSANMMADTTNHAPAAVATTAAATTASTTNESAGKPKRFSIYGGGNSNTMSGSTEKYNANSGVGYHFGVAWEKGGFVYYQFGLRYNNAVYGFNSNITSRDTGDLKVQALDVPLTLGINFLSFAKIVSLRAFISAVPSFTLGVSDNHFGVTKDDVNSFIFYGQIGIGANIAFAFIDIGYNYGASSLMKNSISSTNPGQAYLSLGIRF